MTEHDKADQARKGLVDSVKGKAKEFVGAVIGNDSLTAEGQLEQTQAQERKDANSIEAVADAEAEQARREAVDAKWEGAEERNAVNAGAAAVERSISAQQDAQRTAAEQAEAQAAVREQTQAERDAQREIEQAKAAEADDVSAAAEDFADAADEHEATDHIATKAHEEADRIRARAERLTQEADLT
jgi:uncharacterized protein YjbJ (UPF0337 family)